MKPDIFDFIEKHELQDAIHEKVFAFDCMHLSLLSSLTIASFVSFSTFKVVLEFYGLLRIMLITLIRL